MSKWKPYLNPVFWGAIIVAIGSGYFRYSLHESSLRFAEEFQRQNFSELASSDIFALTSRLNSLSSTIPWVCIEAKSHEHSFFKVERGYCASGVFTDKVGIWAKPNNDINIEFVLTFPRSQLNVGFIFLLTQILMLAIVIWVAKRGETERLMAQIRLSELAQQVSHDIRSPLSALEMLGSSMQDLPEERRVILRNAINRIRDIANSLLAKESSHPIEGSMKSVPGPEGYAFVLLSPIVEAIVSEKRVQYRERLDLNIDFHQSKRSFGLFAKIQSNEFKRLISNLIDNSVEALGSGTSYSGSIVINLSLLEQGAIELEVGDNGKGIPAEIVKRLGQRGETYGKANGSGLGLYHAFETVKGWGGYLRLQSVEGRGTSVQIRLPNRPAPDWFASKLVISKDGKIVAFDDDQSIHQIWRGRFESIRASEQGVSLVHATKPNDFRKIYGESIFDLDNTLFLVDYEILGHPESGLDLIEELGISAHSVLVTSRYEEEHIRSRCERLKVRLLPKTMSGFIPIEIGPVSTTEHV